MDRHLRTVFHPTSQLLYVGDPFQLPPVAPGEPEFSIFDSAYRVRFRTALTEVKRLGEGNPILVASLAVRKGDTTLKGVPRVDRRSKAATEKAMEVIGSGGVVLCYRTRTRTKLNARFRSELGRSGLIQKGEPLLVLRNNYDVERYNGEVIYFAGWGGCLRAILSWLLIVASGKMSRSGSV